MGYSESVLTVILSIVIPWLSGSVLARIFLGPSYHLSSYLGHGYLLGYVVVILWMSLFDAAGISLYFWPLLAAVAATGVACKFALSIPATVSTIDGYSGPVFKPSVGSEIAAWKWLVLGILATITFLQFKLVHDEALLRPTFPWDAWRGWEPETLQHFYSESLHSTIKTVGNYGVIATRIHLWTMLASGEPKAPLNHIPWLFAYIAIGLAVFGQLRMHTGILQSAIGSFACLSMPYLMIHASLAGYADIWLTLAFSLGVFALASDQQEHRKRGLLLVGVYTVTTLLSKRAGIPMSASLLACMVFVLVRWTPAQVALVASVPLLLATFLAATIRGYINFRGEVPLLGMLELNEKYIRLPLIKRYTFEVSSDLSPFSDAIFFYGNWHLGAFLLAACLILLFRGHQKNKWRTVPIVGIFSALVFIAGFFITLDPESAKDQTALSRTLLYITPLVTFTLIALACEPLRALNPEQPDQSRP